jgi:hypothetical protein
MQGCNHAGDSPVGSSRRCRRARKSSSALFPKSHRALQVFCVNGRNPLCEFSPLSWPDPCNALRTGLFQVPYSLSLAHAESGIAGKERIDPGHADRMLQLPTKDPCKKRNRMRFLGSLVRAGLLHSSVHAEAPSIAAEPEGERSRQTVTGPSAWKLNSRLQQSPIATEVR